MSNLKGTKTHQNLKDAFAGESQANRRYLYFAKIADIEGPKFRMLELNQEFERLDAERMEKGRRNG